MLASINPKMARKNRRRQYEQNCAAQLEKIAQHLDGYINVGESPAMAIKRLITQLQAFGVPRAPIMNTVPTQRENTEENNGNTEEKERRLSAGPAEEKEEYSAPLV